MIEKCQNGTKYFVHFLIILITDAIIVWFRNQQVALSNLPPPSDVFLIVFQVAGAKKRKHRHVQVFPPLLYNTDCW